MTIALGLTLLFTQTPQLLAQTRPPKIAQTDTATKVKPIEPGYGQISGRVFDDKKEPLPSSVVQVFQGGILKGGSVTDFDGYYTIAPLEPGYYDVMIQYAGLDTFNTIGVIVQPNNTSTVDARMTRNTVQQRDVMIVGYRVPLVDRSTKTEVIDMQQNKKKKHKTKNHKHINTETEPAKNE